MRQQIRTLQAQMAAMTGGTKAGPSSSHPANPYTGMPIYETDTGLEAYWSGSAWVYPPQLIAKTVLGASTASVTFSSIPQVFTTLRVAWTARSDTALAATYMCLRLNGDSGSDYTYQINQANANAATGGGNSNGTVNVIEIGTMAAATATAGYFGSGECLIPNASGSAFKAVSGHSTSTNSTTNAYSGTYGGLWLSTAAVTSVTLLALAGNLVSGSSVALYGE